MNYIRNKYLDTNIHSILSSTQKTLRYLKYEFDALFEMNEIIFPLISDENNFLNNFT